ncbi:MAG: hypothetical protein V1907_02575 [Candidatus Kerfeldbacteria bacterium]
MHLNRGAVRGGKSTQAIAQIIRAELQGRHPVAFKHVRDTREPGVICSYLDDGRIERPCIMFEDPREVWEQSMGAGVVVIDEVHLAPQSIVDVLIRLEMERQVHVIACGLSSTWQGRAWATMSRINNLPNIKPVDHSAVCDICKGDAFWSQRIRNGVPVHLFEAGEPTVRIGRNDDYRPLCDLCFPKTPGYDLLLARGLIGTIDPDTYFGELPAQAA